MNKQKNVKMLRKKAENGVTLIALIITIIVLLILAGVSISIVAGDNGVLNQAIKAADNMNKENAREELEMAYAVCQSNYLADRTQNGSVVKSAYFTKEKLNEALGDTGEVINIEEDEKSGMSLVTYSSVRSKNTYVFRVNESGKVELIDGIAINKSKVTLQIVDGVPETEALQATLVDSVSWESSNTGVATVDSNTGLVTAVSAGTTTITARCGEYSSTCEVTVKSVVSISSITLDKTSLEIGVGETATITATLNSGATEELVWECSDTSKVAIEASEDGKVTLTLQGLATTSSAVTITAKNNTGTVSTTCSVTVSTPSYVGYYADVDGNGTVDGVIYADLAVGGSGTWGSNTSYGAYTIPTVSSGLKDYSISKKNYEGAFGTKDVLTATGSGSDRFYVMALNDVDSSYHYWYYNANGNMSDYSSTTLRDFGTGKQNTITMVGKWNDISYGSQTTSGSYPDMWGVIQKSTTYPLVTEDGKWFVPSRAEWAAFGGAFGITTSNYSSTYDLNGYYWSSSQYDTTFAYYANFKSGAMGYTYVNSRSYVRLSATF